MPGQMLDQAEQVEEIRRLDMKISPYHLLRDRFPLGSISVIA
jgi:hypothetical protein